VSIEDAETTVLLGFKEFIGQRNPSDVEADQMKRL
jgi:hypothetical protein